MSISCFTPIVNGGWNCWSEWTQCTRSCEGGTRQRYRSCNNPAPSINGHDCFGDNIVTEVCNEEPCVGLEPPIIAAGAVSTTVESTSTDVDIIDGLQFTNLGWRQWSRWTTCSEKGRKHRSRKCTTNRPDENECLGCVKQILRCGGMCYTTFSFRWNFT